MEFNFESELFQKLDLILKSDNIFKQLTNNDEKYKSFITKYPADNLINLSLDQYCLGKDSQPENFCWWLERGLEKVLGRYMPGTSKGHIIYKNKDGSFYKNKQLSDLSPDHALKYTLKIQSLIANANVNEDLLWIDDDDEIYRRSELEPRVTIGDGRKLRILSAYHPDKVLVISSSDHIKHFLLELGHSADDLPATSKPVALMMILREYYEEAKRRFLPELTPFGFVKALYSDQLGIKPIKTVTTEIESEVSEINNRFSLNQILYGPPGTGKTYETINLAVKIAEPEFYLELHNENSDKLPNQIRAALKLKFDELVADKRVVMTTFHQSFSYEDFIEGIRANTSNDDSSLKFNIEDGVFKQICDAASTKSTTNISDHINLDGRRIWKMSLGNTLENEDYIYQECIQNNYILLGYGFNIDFSGCSTRNQVKDVFENEINSVLKDSDYGVTSVFNFINSIKINDLIIISDGNRKFRAIAEVTGNYQFLNNQERNNFQQLRSVKWLQTYEPSKPIEQLFETALSQMTLYELRNHAVNREKLQNLLAPENQSRKSQPYVLIIDEINRGNISRIFGELITLLEDSKRKGRKESLEVTLPYSKKSFTVPDNLYVIGTMNTADKSLAQLDLALRRRFDFVEKLPQPDLLKGITVHNVDIGKMLEVINERIEVLLDADHQIGHSYFMCLKDTMTDSEREDLLSDIFKNKILPLLREYFFDDWSRISLVLNDHNKSKEYRFLSKGGRRSLSELFGNNESEIIQDNRSYLNYEALNAPEAYQGIL